MLEALSDFLWTILGYVFVCTMLTCTVLIVLAGLLIFFMWAFEPLWILLAIVYAALGGRSAQPPPRRRRRMLAGQHTQMALPY